MHPNSVDSCLSSRSPVEEALSEHEERQVSDSESVILVHQDERKEEKAYNFLQKHEKQEEKQKMAHGHHLLSINNSCENQPPQSGTKLLEAKRARVENIVLNIKDNTNQAMDLRRNKIEPGQNFENIFADTTKTSRKRPINGNLEEIQTEFESSEQQNNLKMKASDVVESGGVGVTQQMERLRHKRRRLNHATHLNSSSYSNGFNNESNELFQIGNEITSQHVISGEAYEILVESLKQELKAAVDAIAENSAKRVLEELKFSLTDLEKESNSREDNDKNPTTIRTGLRKVLEQDEIGKENMVHARIKELKPTETKYDQDDAVQTHALSLVKKQSDSPASDKSVFSGDTPSQVDGVTNHHFDDKSKVSEKSYDNFLHGSMKNKRPPNFHSSNPNLSKSPYFQDPNIASPSSSALHFPFYHPNLMSSALIRDPLASTPLIKNPLSGGSYVQPTSLNSASSFQYAPNHLPLPLLQSLHQQQNLANALTDYGRMRNGMDLENERNNSAWPSTRDPHRNPAYTRIQQEPKAESMKSRGISGMDSGPLSMNSMQDGLTPHHLKKAKIMFFFTRYPSASTLKTYFPDVNFTRATTSQLIKWFSNFREFFYIQIEKFARQAINDGVTETKQLKVERESELFRVLNQHYNKCSDFRVGDEFLHVILSSLEEFFLAIQQNKDMDPSWKKPIYKVICKLDQQIPNFFKLPNVIDHLGKIAGFETY